MQNTDIFAKFPSGEIITCLSGTKKSLEKYLVGGTSQGKVFVWNIVTRENCGCTAHTHPVTKVYVHEIIGGWDVISCSSDKSICIFEFRIQTKSFVMKTKLVLPSAIHSLEAWSSTEGGNNMIVFLGCFNGKICSWNKKEGKVKDLHKLTSSISSLSIWSTNNLDDTWILVAGSVGGDIIVYDSALGIINEMSVPNDAKICCVSIMKSSSGKLKVICGTDDDKLHIWDFNKRHIDPEKTITNISTIQL